MGEHQCPLCGRITTGFEVQELHAAQHASAAKDAKIALLRSLLKEFLAGVTHGVFEIGEPEGHEIYRRAFEALHAS